MQKHLDHMICTGIPVDAFVGFKSMEQGIRQKLLIDFDAVIDSISDVTRDSSEDIRIDYASAYQKIKDLFATTHFNLIETIAERICHLLLQSFGVHSVTVSVTKRPLDMQDVTGVTYRCERSRR